MVHEVTLPKGSLCLSEPTLLTPGHKEEKFSSFPQGPYPKGPRLTEKYFLPGVPGGQTLSSLQSEAPQMEAHIIQSPALGRLCQEAQSFLAEMLDRAGCCSERKGPSSCTSGSGCAAWHCLILSGPRLGPVLPPGPARPHSEQGGPTPETLGP